MSDDLTLSIRVNNTSFWGMDRTVSVQVKRVNFEWKQASQIAKHGRNKKKSKMKPQCQIYTSDTQVSQQNTKWNDNQFIAKC